MSTFKATATKNQEGGFEKAPPGTHPAVLVGIIDLGEQWDEPFSTKPDPKTGRVPKAKWVHRLYFVYELTSKKKAGGGGNHMIAIDLTFSLNELAKMRKWIEARTGRVITDGSDYDVMQELGQPVLITVKMKGEYPRIEGVTGIPDGLTVPDPLTKPIAWFMDPAKVEQIPGWAPYLYGSPIKEVVRQSRQIAGERREPPAGGPAGESTAVATADGDEAQDKEIPF